MAGAGALSSIWLSCGDTAVPQLTRGRLSWGDVAVATIILGWRLKSTGWRCADTDYDERRVRSWPIASFRGHPPVRSPSERSGHRGAGFSLSTRPSVMGPMRSSPPCDRHAAELTLLSVVDAKAATLCLLEGAVSLSRYACSSCDDHWPCNGFTASTVPATGLRAVGLRSAYSHLVFLLVIPAPRSGAR